MRRCDEAVDVVEEYEFRVIGKLSPTMLAALNQLSAVPSPGDTVLRGSVRDQAELYEHIARFESLGLKLRELRRVSLPSSTSRA
jgi:hypothetical protein